jgi:hypothetical protein
MGTDRNFTRTSRNEIDMEEAVDNTLSEREKKLERSARIYLATAALFAIGVTYLEFLFSGPVDVLAFRYGGWPLAAITAPLYFLAILMTIGVWVTLLPGIFAPWITRYRGDGIVRVSPTKTDVQLMVINTPQLIAIGINKSRPLRALPIPRNEHDISDRDRHRIRRQERRLCDHRRLQTRAREKDRIPRRTHIGTIPDVLLAHHEANACHHPTNHPKPRIHDSPMEAR